MTELLYTKEVSSLLYDTMYPVMIPLGSSGGDHMIFTVLEVTSGNQSLTGGPGTEISDQRH